MNFSIEASDLQKAIKLLGVTAKMNTKDSTSMILLDANKNNTVTFLSDNNSTGLSYVSDKVIVKTPSITAIEYGKIKSFVSSFHPWNGKYGVKDFYFNIDDNKLNISVINTYENGETSEGKFDLKIYDPYSIRQPEQFKKPNFILNSIIFRTATSKVLYAMNPGETKLFIQGMNINFDEDNIYFVGTNGAVLSEYKIKNISDLDKGNFLLKYDFIMGLRRALGEESQVSFEISKREIKAVFENVCIWGRNIIGHSFPDYKHVLEAYEHSIVLDKDVLMGSLSPFMDILDPEDNYRLVFSLNDKNMRLYNDVASFKYNNEVDFSGDFTIDVNGKYMAQTIDAIKDDKIVVKFSDEKGVLIFDSANFNDQAALVVPLVRR